MKFSNIKYCFVALALISMTACHTKEVKVANHESDVVKVETAGIQLLHRHRLSAQEHPE